MSDWHNTSGKIIETPQGSDNDAVKAYEAIFEQIIPDSIDFFRFKTKDYAGGPAFLLLGSGGQFSDINRKFWKLYQALWLGQPLEGEQPEEIVKDFIGHCWLLLYCLREESQSSVFKDIMNDLSKLGSKIGVKEPTPEQIKDANECPSCDAHGICPSHKWIHEWNNRVDRRLVARSDYPNGPAQGHWERCAIVHNPALTPCLDEFSNTHSH